MIYCEKSSVSEKIQNSHSSLVPSFNLMHAISMNWSFWILSLTYDNCLPLFVLSCELIDVLSSGAANQCPEASPRRYTPALQDHRRTPGAAPIGKRRDLEDNGGHGEVAERHDHRQKQRRIRLLPGGKSTSEISTRSGKTAERVARDWGLLY